MARFVVCASPLVKVYLTEWHERLLDEPELLQDADTDFSFDVVTGCGAFKVDYNKPMMVTAGRDDDPESKYLWLIGEAVGSANETDIYGLVPFETSIDMVQRSDEISRLSMKMLSDAKNTEKYTAAIQQIQKDTTEAISKVRGNAIARSEHRIKRAMKSVHNNLVRQWQRNEEMKLGKFPPSMSELFGAHVLDADIRRAAAKGEKIKSRMGELMSNQVV